MGFCKEYHVFDALFSPDLSKQKGKLFEKIRSRNWGLVKKEVLRQSFIRTPEKYFNYFDRLYHLHKKTEAVGDMTPSYSMLDAEAYQFIRDRLEQRGFHTKVIFMMRDPIERSWSMFHQAAKVKKAMQSGEIRQPGISTFINPQTDLRTRYDRTITELEKVFPQEDLFYGFYENFFNSDSYSKLGEFLGINLCEPTFDLVKNSSLMKGPVPQDLAEEAARYYAPTYDFILRRFGERMKDLWEGFRYL